MKITVNIKVESDDGKHAESSVSSVGVDTRLPGIDPDSAKEDFIAQARGLLTSVGETHVPALYAAVQGKVITAKDATGKANHGEDKAPAEREDA